MEPYTLELKKFIDCVDHGTAPAVTGEEALKVLRVALAALESSAMPASCVPGSFRRFVV